MNTLIKTQSDQATITERLTDVQETALDLYARGFNVFPLPSAHEWRNRSGFKENPNKKPPYMVNPLYYSRLHVCSPECHHKPLEPEKTFVSLFYRSNIGLMMGRTSGNTLAIDCDSQPAYREMGARLNRQELPFWAISSHRGGAYLLRLMEGEAVNLRETAFKDVQVWGSHQYIVLPPSVHPLGTVYQWVTPEPRYHLPSGVGIPPVSISGLEWLGVKLARGNWQEPELFGLPDWAGMLSYKNRETLAHGAVEGERNTRLMRVAYDLAGCGIPYEVSETYLLQAAEKCYPEYPEGDTKAILKCAYRKPDVTPAREYQNHAHPISKDWQTAEKFASAFDWRAKYKRKAGSHRRVFLACVKRAQMENRPIFRASVRDVSNILNRDGKRLLEVIKSLCADGLLVYVGQAISGASLYRFGDIVIQSFNSEMPTVSPPCSLSVGNSERPKMTIPNTDAEKDAFVRLGQTAWHVWKYLIANPTHSRYAIAKALNLPPSSVYEAVSRLLAVNRVTYSSAEGLYYGESATNSTLEVLAVDLGTNGKSEKIRNQNQIEREIWINCWMAKAKENYGKSKSQNQ